MLAQSFIPLITGIVIDDGILRHDQKTLLGWGSVMFGLVVVQAVAATLQMRCDFSGSTGGAFLTMRLVNHHAANLGADLRQRISAGEVINIGIGDITPIGNALAAISRGAGAAIAVIVVAVIMLTTAWQIGLIILAGVPAILWLLTRVQGPVRKRQSRLRQQEGELTSIAVDISAGLRILRGMGGEEHFADQYRAQSQRTRQFAVGAAKAQGGSAAVRTILTGAVSTAVVWLAARLVLSHQLQVGQLIAFYGYAMFLVIPLNWLTDFVEFLAAGRVSAERVTQFLLLSRDFPDGPPAQEAAHQADLADPQSGLTIPFGSFTAVACASPGDAGRLSDRLGPYVTSGVTLGGIPLTELTLATVRERILVVRNDDHLFAGPLGAGLDPTGHAPAEKILSVAGTASAADIIEALPGGLDGDIQAGGRNFSGGERQRLRLLRALLTDPDVLVLVDPTSGLDALTEAQVMRQMRATRQGKTTVVFSTRSIVLSHADEVGYVEEGKVVAHGPHRRLLTDTRYETLVARGV